MKVSGRRETGKMLGEVNAKQDWTYMQREEETVSFKFICLNFQTFEINKFCHHQG